MERSTTEPKRLQIAGQGVDLARVQAAGRDFGLRQAEFAEAQAALWEQTRDYYKLLGEVVTGKVLRVTKMNVQSFEYYAGRWVRGNDLGEVTSVGERRYRYVDPGKLRGRLVLGLGVEDERLSTINRDVDWSRTELTPTITLAYSEREYKGQLSAVSLEVVREADEEFIEQHREKPDDLDW